MFHLPFMASNQRGKIEMEQKEVLANRLNIIPEFSQVVWLQLLSQTETPVLHKTEPGVRIYIHKTISQKTASLTQCF